MKERLDFIEALAQAVVAISVEGFDTWEAAHKEDPFFQRIVARLLVLQKFHDQESIDDLCVFLINNDLIPAPQSVPSEYFWPYKTNVCFSSPRAVIRKRVPARVTKPMSGRLVGAPGSWRWGTWEIFKKAVQCLWKQPATGGEDDMMDGPMGRNKWFDLSSGTGLFWLNFFMQQTLDFMYGPGKPNKWPFDFQVPPWCIPNRYHFELTAYGWEGYAALGNIFFPPAGMSYGSGITLHIRVRPDDRWGNPGEMEGAKLFSEHASMSTDFEVRGAYTEQTLIPLTGEWQTWPLTATPYQDDPWLYQYLSFLLMSGDYLIDFFVSTDLNFDEPEDFYFDTFGGIWY